MKKKSGKWMGFVLAISLALTTAGCSVDGSSEKITVKDNNNVSYNQMMMQKIDKYKDISAIEWLNNDQIFANGNNNLSLYNLKTKQTKILYKFNYKYWNSYPSPDKKHAFVQASNSDDGTNNLWFMLDVTSKKLIPVSFDFSNDLFIQSSNWSDNEKLIIINAKGAIYEVHINGKTAKLKHTLENTEEFEDNYQLVQVEDKLFYLDQYRLFVWDKKTNKTKMLMNPVEHFTISPDKTKIAVEKIIPVNPKESFAGKDNTKTNESLVVMDLSGKILSTVDEGQDIGGTGWSPDSKKLAYDGGKNELYISDVYKPQPKLLAVNILGLYTDYDPIKWSPSGNKLLINGYSDPVNGPDYDTPVLHIITLGSNT